MRPDTPVLNIPPVLPSASAPGGILKPALGGTGLDGSVVSAGQLLIGSPSIFGFVLRTLTAGSGVTIVDGDGSITISSTGGGGVTPFPLTGVNDTNVSISLSGTPSAALLAATTITLGWIGKLSQARGGTGIDTSGVTDGQLLIGATSGHAFSLGTITAGNGIAVTNAGGSITLSSPEIIPVPLTPPVDANYSWANQGGASVNPASNMIYLLAPATSGNNLRMRVLSTPATPYTLTACVIPNIIDVNFCSCGMVWRDSVSGKVITFGYGGATHGVSVSKFTSPTVFSATYTSLALTIPGPFLWFKMTDDGTNRISKFSYDGINYRTLHTVSRTDFLTANQIGFYADPNQTTGDSAITLVSWTF